MADVVELTLPESVVAAVLLRHAADGALLAHYVEGQTRVPAPRAQVAHVLTALAVELLKQAAELDGGTE